MPLNVFLRLVSLPARKDLADASLQPANILPAVELAAFHSIVRRGRRQGAASVCANSICVCMETHAFILSRPSNIYLFTWHISVCTFGVSQITSL